MNDRYLTIKTAVSSEIKVKGSRFVGWLSPVADREDASAMVRKAQKQYHDATHHCYAYRIGLGDRLEFRYHDDGEPSGTAGKPILDVLEGNRITDCICIVTRYFGGTKLGTGGLARAYGRCAGESVAKANIVEAFIFYTLTAVFDYALTGAVMSVLSRYQCRIVRTEYLEETRLQLSVRHSQKEALQEDLLNCTAGRIRFYNLKEV